MRIALDTNVLAYAEGVNTEPEHDIAAHLLDHLPLAATVVPAQVLGELFNVLTRKRRFPPSEAGRRVRRWMATYLIVPTSPDVIDAAMSLAASHQLNGWDAVVLAAAAQAGCQYLLSEDMHPGFVWRGVTVVNPFAGGVLPAGLAALFGS